MPRIVVGVDAGGSHTTAAVADGERICGVAAGGCGNPNVAGAAAAAEILRCIDEALGARRADAIVAGIAGASDPGVQRSLRDAFARRFPESAIAICHDARIALRAAIPHGDGLVLVAGTGSIAYAEVGGQTFRAGGGGYRGGDPGSAYAIGAAALAQTAGRSVPEIAAHARVVLERAHAGDRAAAAIVERAANDLAEMIFDVASRAAVRALPLAFAGGLLREPNALTEALERQIAAGLAGLRPLATRVPPYVGALAAARRLLERS